MSRTYLSSPQTWSLDLSGDDSWAGDAMNPWRNPQYAVEKLQMDYDFGGAPPTLKINDGSWTVTSGLDNFLSGNGPCVGLTGKQFVPGSVTFNILGNQTNPQNCIINLSAGQYGFSFGNNFIGSLYGFKFQNPVVGGVGSIPLFASNGGSCDFDDIIFGANPYNVNCYAVAKGEFLMLGGSKSAIIGNTPIQFAAEEGGVIKVATNIDIPNALTFSQYAQTFFAGAFIALTHVTYTGANKNNCTGSRGYAGNTSSIRVDGDLTRLLGSVAATHGVTGSID